MKPFTKLNKKELLEIKNTLDLQYQEFNKQDLNHDLSRCKP